jgi:hypothetical protein
MDAKTRIQGRRSGKPRGRRIVKLIRPSDDERRYNELAGELRMFAAALPEPLPTLCGPFLEELLGGSFARIVALLPSWLTELLPVPEAAAMRLGAAQLFGWWHVALRDGVLDGQMTPDALLGGQLALLRALDIYRELGAMELPSWPRLAELERRAAAAYAREVASRPVAGVVDRAALAPWGAELIAERGASLHFAAYVQMDLCGLSAADGRRAAIDGALRALVIARQIGDDAGDWLDDLRAGRLNYVSATLAQRVLAEDHTMALTVERLAGRHVGMEPFWDELRGLHGSLCAEGINKLAPFGSTRLGALLKAEAARGVSAASQGASWRATARALFGAQNDAA